VKSTDTPRNAELQPSRHPPVVPAPGANFPVTDNAVSAPAQRQVRSSAIKPGKSKASYDDPPSIVLCPQTKCRAPQLRARCFGIYRASDLVVIQANHQCDRLSTVFALRRRRIPETIAAGHRSCGVQNRNIEQVQWLVGVKNRSHGRARAESALRWSFGSLSNPPARCMSTATRRDCPTSSMFRTTTSRRANVSRAFLCMFDRPHLLR
jgi:hypothetical protein